MRVYDMCVHVSHFNFNIKTLSYIKTSLIPYFLFQLARILIMSKIYLNKTNKKIISTVINNHYRTKKEKDLERRNLITLEVVS